MSIKRHGASGDYIDVTDRNEWAMLSTGPLFWRVSPETKVAGVYMDLMLGADVFIEQPLLHLHAETAGELAYASRNPDIIEIGV